VFSLEGFLKKKLKERKRERGRGRVRHTCKLGLQKANPLLLLFYTPVCALAEHAVPCIGALNPEQNHANT
jgi:hypothetical protein